MEQNDPDQNTVMNDQSNVQQPNEQIGTSQQQQDHTNDTQERQHRKVFDYSDLKEVSKIKELLRNPELKPIMSSAKTLEDKSVVVELKQLAFVPSFANLIRFGSQEHT